MRRPQREALADLPGRVTIYEVGPHDGLQNERTPVPVEVKAELIRRLVAAGPGGWMAGHPGRPSPSRVVKALAGSSSAGDND
jgi:isopropylmalate/homocitrate/citramalate synthase